MCFSTAPSLLAAWWDVGGMGGTWACGQKWCRRMSYEQGVTLLAHSRSIQRANWSERRRSAAAKVPLYPVQGGARSGELEKNTPTPQDHAYHAESCMAYVFLVPVHIEGRKITLAIEDLVWAMCISRARLLPFLLPNHPLQSETQ